jgi:hypothetical protein
MKRIILCGLAGVLALLLAQSPQIARAMDSGVMDSGGYGRYDMGPGMMHDGGSQNYGMGPQMMGRSYEEEPHYPYNHPVVNREEAARIFEDYLNSRHNPNLKLGHIKDEGPSFEADLLTQNNSLVDKLLVDKDTGRMRSAY